MSQAGPRDGPKELYIDDKWDKLIVSASIVVFGSVDTRMIAIFACFQDVTMRRVVYGGVAGGLVGLVLLRKHFPSMVHIGTSADVHDVMQVAPVPE
jgi:hypothetical protein